ncbi:hypothetical protein ACFX13_033412 [Malus domestica]
MDENANSMRKQSNVSENKLEGTQRRWKCEWDRERPVLDRKLQHNLKRPESLVWRVSTPQMFFKHFRRH